MLKPLSKETKKSDVAATQGQEETYDALVFPKPEVPQSPGTTNAAPEDEDVDLSEFDDEDLGLGEFDDEDLESNLRKIDKWESLMMKKIEEEERYVQELADGNIFSKLKALAYTARALLRARSIRRMSLDEILNSEEAN